MSAAFDIFNHKFVLGLKDKISHNVELGLDALGNIQRIVNALDSLPKLLEEAKQRLANVENQLENAKSEVNKPFEKEQELSEKLERLSELNALLNMDEKGEDIAEADEVTSNPKEHERVSVKEKLVEMKAKVSETDRMSTMSKAREEVI